MVRVPLARIAEQLACVEVRIVELQRHRRYIECDLAELAESAAGLKRILAAGVDPEVDVKTAEYNGWLLPVDLDPVQ